MISGESATGFIWVGSLLLGPALRAAGIHPAGTPLTRDFGLVTLALVVISLSNIFSELGLDGTIVQFPEIDKRLPIPHLHSTWVYPSCSAWWWQPLLPPLRMLSTKNS
jgi:hypothetical protein